MRLHRRKEAGIVVDFAEAGAPHTERTVTLHSLLNVDAYRPGGLVTPPPNRRRRRRKPAKPIIKEQPWIVPVSDDPERRIAVIASQWKLVDASKLALDEQRAWAVVAARAVTPSDVNNLAERIAALQPESRELFLYTCSAENRHRRLRLTALGDLAAQRPSQTTFAMACRLVEAAPTWQQDRGQGARVLLLAMGDDKIEAPADRIVSWTWQLARAARDHQYRYAGSPHHRRPQPAGRAGRCGIRTRARRSRCPSGTDRPHRPSRGRRGAARGGLAAARIGSRADGRSHPPGAFEGSSTAGRCAGLQHSRADAAGQVRQAGKAQSRGRADADRVVQRGGGRLDASRGPGEQVRSGPRDRDRSRRRSSAARRRRRGGGRATRLRPADPLALERRRAALQDRDRGARGGRRQGAACRFR